MKIKRQTKIMELIKNRDVDTQEELLMLLRAAGFECTQATVSRDIRELKIVKASNGKGGYRYVSATLPTSALSSPVRIILLSLRAPQSRAIESMIILLPAPVSPVKTVSPSERSISSSFIRATERICNEKSISVFYAAPICSFNFTQIR